MARAPRRFASCNVRGRKVGHVHLRYLNPLPADLGDILSRFEDVLIPELNLGQLRMMIRGQYLVDAIGLNKVQGKPFIVAEIVQAIESLLSTNGHSHPHNQTSKSPRRQFRSPSAAKAKHLTVTDSPFHSDSEP